MEYLPRILQRSFSWRANYKMFQLEVTLQWHHIYDIDSTKSSSQSWQLEIIMKSWWKWIKQYICNIFPLGSSHNRTRTNAISFSSELHTSGLDINVCQRYPGQCQTILTFKPISSIQEFLIPLWCGTCRADQSHQYALHSYWIDLILSKISSIIKQI